MTNLLKAKIGFQSGIKAGSIGGLAFIFILIFTYFLVAKVSFTDLPFLLTEILFLLPFAIILGATIGGVLGILISLAMKTPRYAIQIGMITGIIIGSLYPILLLIFDNHPRHLILLFIGLIVGAFAGRYGGLDFKARYSKIR